MRLLTVMDPLSTVQPDKDTTFAFLRSAESRGHENLTCEVRDVYLTRGEVRARARATYVSDTAPHTRLGAEHDVALADVAAVLVRKDPPFDAAYLSLTLLHEHARGKTLLINDPRALREFWPIATPRQRGEILGHVERDAREGSVVDSLYWEAEDGGVDRADAVPDAHVDRPAPEGRAHVPHP